MFLLNKGDFEMALIICEECGKQFSDKASACPNCGCPVQQKNSEKNQEEIAKYINLAINAIKSENSDLVEKYCQEVLEIDSQNSKAWELQARGILFNATLKSNKITQAIACADNAVKFSGDDKEALASNLYDAICVHINGLLSIALTMPLPFMPQYVAQVMGYYGELLCGISFLSKEKMINEINSLETMDKNSQKAIMPSKRMIFASHFGKPSWAQQFYKRLQEQGKL